MKNKPHKTKEERSRARREVMSLLYEGIPFRRIESVTGMNAGSISRIKKSKEYASYCVDMMRAAGGEVTEASETPLSDSASRALRMNASEYDRKVKTDRFIQAVAVGGVEYARMYARCTIGEMAAILENVEILHHAAKPRIAVLCLLLKMAHDQNEPGQVRIKAATEWWRLANGESEKSLINIDARTTDAASQQKPDPVMMMLESVKSAIDNIDSLDLMSKPNAG